MTHKALKLLDLCRQLAQESITCMQEGLEMSDPFRPTSYNLVEIKKSAEFYIYFKNGHIKGGASIELELAVYQEGVCYFADLVARTDDMHYKYLFGRFEVCSIVDSLDQVDFKAVCSALKNFQLSAIESLAAYRQGLHLLSIEPKLEALFDELRDWGFSVKSIAPNYFSKEDNYVAHNRFIVSDYFSNTKFELGVEYSVETRAIDAANKDIVVKAYLKNYDSRDVLDSAYINHDIFKQKAIVFPWVRLCLKNYCRDAMLG